MVACIYFSANSRTAATPRYFYCPELVYCSSLKTKTHWPDPAWGPLLYDPQAKNDFYIYKSG